MKPALCLHHLRPSLALDQELEWFWNRAECDMGVQSNYLAMLGRHGPGSQVPLPEDAVEAAHKHRLMRGWLDAIGDIHAGVLRAAYELRAWPVPLWDEVGRLTGVVVRLACVGEVIPTDLRGLQALEMVRAAWLATHCPRASRDPAIARLRTEAEVRFAKAHFAYSVARGKARFPARQRTR